MELIAVAIWDGNYPVAVAILVQYNPDIRVRVSGSKLIVKDLRKNHYECVNVGNKIKIPKYGKEDTWIEHLEEDEET